MEIIHAKVAYADTLLAEYEMHHSLFEKMIRHFNKKVKEEAMAGFQTCFVLWKEFDIDEAYATDCEATAELLSSIIGAGYEAVFCYNGPNISNPCGIVVGWGPEANECIEDFFQHSKNLFKGE